MCGLSERISKSEHPITAVRTEGEARRFTKAALRRPMLWMLGGMGYRYLRSRVVYAALLCTWLGLPRSTFGRRCLLATGTLAITFLVKFLRWRYHVAHTWLSIHYDKFPDVRETTTYKDPTLMERAWNLPVAKFYKDTPTWFQPMSGYCGYATLNTVLQSLPNPGPFLQYGRCPRHLTLRQLKDVTDRMASTPDFAGCFRTVETFSGPSLESTYSDHLRLLNDPRYRYVAVFLRGPLFFNDVSDPAARRGSTQKFAAHWSPLVGFLEEEQLVLLLDVNEAYGAHLVPATQLFNAIHNRNFISGTYRGIIRFTV